MSMWSCKWDRLFFTCYEQLERTIQILGTCEPDSAGKCVKDSVGSWVNANQEQLGLKSCLKPQNLTDAPYFVCCRSTVMWLLLKATK